MKRIGNPPDFDKMADRQIDKKRLLIAVVISGMAIGFATFMMKEGIKWIGVLASRGMHVDRSNALLLFLPVAGIVLSMLLQKYLLHQDLSHGTAMVKRDLKNGKYELSSDLMYTSILGCSLTIGFGGSAGAEGPSAYTGAAVASNIARWLNIDDNWEKILLGMGAGAGIAGIFKSPVGGALFTIEVLGMEFASFPVILLVLMCVISACTALALGGFSIDMPFIEYMPFNPKNFLWVTFLGFFCGLYSLYYSRSFKFTAGMLGRISNPWIKSLIAGICLSAAIFLFPALFGEGYGIVGDLINMRSSSLLDYSPFHTAAGSVGTIMLVTAVVLLLKAVSVSCTINGGGVAGTYAPTLFAGCLAGYLFGLMANHWLGVDLPAENFALLGMVGVMSGVVRAPLMAMFITIEMCNSYQFIFGFFIVAFVSFGVVRLCEKLGDRISSGGKKPQGQT